MTHSRERDTPFGAMCTAVKKKVRRTVNQSIKINRFLLPNFKANDLLYKSMGQSALLQLFASGQLSGPEEYPLPG